MVIISIINNILLSFIIALIVCTLYSFLIYKALPMLTNFTGVFRKSITKVFTPIFLILFLTLTVSWWIVLIVPIILLGIYFYSHQNINTNRLKLHEIKKQNYIPVIEEWISFQKDMKISKYEVFLESKNNEINSTVFLYIKANLDYHEIRLLEEKLPQNTLIRINNFEKKRIIGYSL